MTMTMTTTATPQKEENKFKDTIEKTMKTLDYFEELLNIALKCPNYKVRFQAVLRKKDYLPLTGKYFLIR